MGVGVEASVESAPNGGLNVRTLGQLRVLRGDTNVALPASRKVRGLFAYLALSAHPVPRARLCELLWETANDPRGELRWCLSKLRSILDEPGRSRVVTSGDLIEIDLSDCLVDVAEIANATQSGYDSLSAARRQALIALFEGEFLEGLTLERCPQFDRWVQAERRRLSACHITLLEQMAKGLGDGSGAALPYLENGLSWRPMTPMPIWPCSAP